MYWDDIFNWPLPCTVSMKINCLLPSYSVFYKGNHLLWEWRNVTNLLKAVLFLYCEDLKCKGRSYWNINWIIFTYLLLRPCVSLRCYWNPRSSGVWRWGARLSHQACCSNVFFSIFWNRNIHFLGYFYHRKMGIKLCRNVGIRLRSNAV